MKLLSRLAIAVVLSLAWTPAPRAWAQVVGEAGIGALPTAAVPASLGSLRAAAPALAPASVIALSPLPGAAAVLAAPAPTTLPALIPAAAEAASADTSAAVEAAPADAKVLSLLRGLDTIRVVFAKAPGYGHQMATLSLVNRLRELGYAGRIDAVFEDDQELRGKLGQLIPEFNPRTRGPQRVESLGMTLRSDGHLAVDPSRVRLALTGGADERRHFAQRFDADVFLRLAPFGWAGYQDEVWIDGRNAPLPIPDTAQLPLLYKPAPEAAAEDGLSRLDPANVPTAKVAGLKTLLRELDQHDSLAAYGLHFMETESLARLATAVSHALDAHPELFKGRGVVIPLLLDSRKKVRDLQIWNDIGQLGPALRTRLKFAFIDDPRLGETLKGLQKDDILFLETGGVPPAVFERLFAHSTLPPTLEGKNATNLARLLGIPYLPMQPNAFDGLIDRVPSANNERHAVQTLLNRYTPQGNQLITAALWPDTDYPPELISAYITAAMTPGSALRRMFERARLDPTDRKNDKLWTALEYAADAVLSFAPAASPMAGASWATQEALQMAYAGR